MPNPSETSSAFKKKKVCAKKLFLIFYLLFCPIGILLSLFSPLHPSSVFMCALALPPFLGNQFPSRNVSCHPFFVGYETHAKVGHKQISKNYQLHNTMDKKEELS